MNISLNNYNALMEREYGWGVEDYFDFNLGISDAQQDPHRVLSILQRELEEVGVHFGNAYYGVQDPAARAILAAEAVNWAAKTIDENWYDVKAAACQAALTFGALAWVEDDEYNNPVLYIFHREVGTASFHFPDTDELFSMEGEKFHGYGLQGRFPWSGIGRQDQAFDLLQNVELLEQYAWATRPRSCGYPGLPSLKNDQVPPYWCNLVMKNNDLGVIRQAIEAIAEQICAEIVINDYDTRICITMCDHNTGHYIGYDFEPNRLGFEVYTATISYPSSRLVQAWRKVFDIFNNINNRLGVRASYSC